MKIIDYITITKTKVFRNKSNIYLLLQFCLINFLLLLAVVVRSNFNDLISDLLSKNIGFRSLSVTVNTDEEDLGFNTLSNINHVISVYSSKYDTYTTLSSFKSDSLDGYIDLIYTESSINPDIIYGIAIDESDSGVAICPLNFYPSSDAYNFVINLRNTLDGQSLLGSSFEVQYGDDKIMEFTIVGIYDSDVNSMTSNSCYISASDMIEMVGGIDTESNSYYNFVVIVDDVDNLSIVRDEILNLGFLDVSLRAELDTSVINIVEVICNFIVTLIIVGALALSISYIRKQQIYDQKNSGILRALGFGKKQIFVIEYFTYLSINLISYLINLIVFNIVFIILKYFILNNYSFSGLIISVSISSYIFVFVIMVVIITIIEFLLIKRSLNNSIINIVRSES